jgi:hypothetical protein
MGRPSPGSKHRWLSFGLSRLGCSKTNGIPSTPSRKSIDVRRVGTDDRDCGGRPGSAACFASLFSRCSWLTLTYFI